MVTIVHATHNWSHLVTLLLAILTWSQFSHTSVTCRPPAAAVEVGADPLDGAGVLVGAAGAVEGERRVRVVEIPSCGENLSARFERWS